jgi:hypothetical protein
VVEVCFCAVCRKPGERPHSGTEHVCPVKSVQVMLLSSPSCNSSGEMLNVECAYRRSPRGGSMWLGWLGVMVGRCDRTGPHDFSRALGQTGH